jgi:hypothetical protein
MHFWQSIKIALTSICFDNKILIFRHALVCGIDDRTYIYTYKMITKLLHEHEGELHKEEIDYITNFTFTESYFYGLTMSEY